jgi:hypothetical protein
LGEGVNRQCKKKCGRETNVVGLHNHQLNSDLPAELRPTFGTYDRCRAQLSTEELHRNPEVVTKNLG